MKSSLIASALVVAGLCASAQAADVFLGFDVKSAYIASGTTCNDGFVFCPWADIGGLKVGDTALPIAFGVWANYDLEDSFGTFVNEDGSKSKTLKKGTAQEIDFNVDLDLAQVFGLEDWSLKLGYLEYDYPRGGDPNQLVRASVGYDLFSVTAKYRLDEATKNKCEIIPELSYSFELCEDLSLGLTADCVYIVQADGDPLDDGFACADFTASLNYCAFYVSATYCAQIDDDVLPDATAENPWGYDVDWVFAVGASYGF